MTDRSANNSLDRRLCLAPMMECTDRHFRYLLRRLSRRILLCTEMVHGRAVLHGDRERHLAFDRAEHPVAIQLGGSEPAVLAEAAEIAAGRGYDEINLNIGCPSDRVQSGRFGACLMAEPDRVAECVAAMRERVSVPVTVKTRIGIDHRDEYAFLLDFVDRVAAAGCGTFYIHARKAWLKGLSPKENREVPPLDYERVMRLKADRPCLEVVLNGGIRELEGASAWLERGIDGVMIGREAYANPWMLAGADEALFGDGGGPADRETVVTDMLDYIEREVSAGTPLNRITRHMLGLFQGIPGARRWRRHLTEHGHRKGAGPDVVRAALAEVTSAAA